MKIGYARVSTVGQDLESQIELLKEQECKEKNIYVEKVTGTSTAPRKELKRILGDGDQEGIAREGDQVIVTKIDRLARSIIDLNKIVKALNEKGVGVQFIKDSISFEAGEQNNSMNQLIFNMLGSFAQFERDLIVERTTEGRERAKKQGKHMGRPAKPKKSVERAMKLYQDRKDNHMSVADIVKMTGIPRSTIYHVAKGMKRNES